MKLVMTVRLELKPDIEANLAAQARARGVPLDAYLQSVVENLARTMARTPGPGNRKDPIARNSMRTGGEGGIRTHGTRKGSTVFETARFNHSRTSPDQIAGTRSRRRLHPT